MTKKLEALLNLAPAPEELDNEVDTAEAQAVIEENQAVIDAVNTTKIGRAHV